VFEDASDGLLQNLEVQGTVRVVGDRTRLSGVRVRGFAVTSLLMAGDDNQVLHADLGSSEGTALELTGARNRLADCSVTGSSGAELRGVDAVVVRNHIFGGPSTGLTISGFRHRVVDNDLSAAFGWGLAVSGATDVVARDNRVDGGFDSDAVVVKDTSATYLRGNDVTGTGPDGIHVAASATGTLLRLNTVHGLRDDGIDVESADARLGSNTAGENGDLGIEAMAGVTDLAATSPPATATRFSARTCSAGEAAPRNAGGGERRRRWRSARGAARDSFRARATRALCCARPMRRIVAACVLMDPEIPAAGPAQAPNRPDTILPCAGSPAPCSPSRPSRQRRLSPRQSSGSWPPRRSWRSARR
jgi:hypothetical protein